MLQHYILQVSHRYTQHHIVEDIRLQSSYCVRSTKRCM